MLKGKKSNTVMFNFKGKKIRIPGNFGMVDVVRTYGLSRADEEQISKTFKSVCELVRKPSEAIVPVVPALVKAQAKEKGSFLTIGLSNENLQAEEEMRKEVRDAEQARIDELMAEEQAKIDAIVNEGLDPIELKKKEKAERKPLERPKRDIDEEKDVLSDVKAVEVTGDAKDKMLKSLLGDPKPVKEIKIPKKGGKKAKKGGKKGESEDE